MKVILKERIERAKELLRTAKHASMATVNQDGSPHNTPFMFLHDERLEHIYLASHPDSEHSKNVLRTGQAFIVIYDAFQSGGLYMRCEDIYPLEEGAELNKALAINNQVRVGRGKDELPLSFYAGGNPQLMWSATIKQLWVNTSLRGKDGHRVQDIRTEITADMLTR
jgi:hypothetical protein